jgi:hypothetical protein
MLLSTVLRDARPLVAEVAEPKVQGIRRAGISRAEPGLFHPQLAQPNKLQITKEGEQR